jgi:hypothetical protein
MNSLLFRFLAATTVSLVLLLPACREKPKNPVEKYGDAVIDAYTRSEKVSDKASLNEIRGMLRTYRTDHGQWPASLQDLQGTMVRPVDLSKFDYDPQTGEVTLADTGTP